MARLDTVDARSKLKPRAEPYWLKLSTGCVLRYRKMVAGSIGTWLARYRDAETGQRDKRSLGHFDGLPASQRFDAAKKAAEEWFEHRGKGGGVESVTVRMACERYVEHVRSGRGNAPADDLEMRFKRWVFGDKLLAYLDLTKLTKTRVEAWRRSMAKTPVIVSRDMREAPLTRLKIGQDKTGRNRKIRLPEATATEFLGRCGDRPASAPLFCREDGKPWNKDAWKGPIKQAVAAAELSTGVTAYALRHSVITDLVTGGLDLLTVAQLSGTSVAMIERHYRHLRC